MEKKQIIDEIKQMERDLYLKKSKLSSDEAMECGEHIQACWVTA